MALTKCPDCKAQVEDFDGPTHPYFGANAGCWKIYGEICAREYSNPSYMKLHRLTVDAYAVQHPGRPDRRAAQSVWVHLISLYLVLENGIDPERATRVLGRIVEKNKHSFTWLNPPSDLGTITVLDVLAAKNAPEHLQVIEKWAKSCWQAWHNYHSQVKSAASPFMEMT